MIYLNVFFNSILYIGDFIVKICTVIGARPQFIKAAAVSSKIIELKNKYDIEEVIIHTGQHYDALMSDIFFNQLNIPKEKYNINVGSGSHAVQTAKMLEKIEKIIISEKPDIVLTYGDTNSTLAGVLTASKLNIKTAHIEAGMRSFNRQMPEEINRVVTDHLSDLNFCSTQSAVQNLKNEGRGETAYLTGDVMYDCALKFINTAEKNSNPLKMLGFEKSSYILMTCHRAENTDSYENLKEIIEGVNNAAELISVLYPIHPRTAKMIKEFDLKFSEKVKIIDPLSYFDMLILEKNAAIILTDSGGVQKEAFFFKTPCITMRNETEWTETVDEQMNILTGPSGIKITDAVKKFLSAPIKNSNLQPYGNGNASEKIIDIIMA